MENTLWEKTSATAHKLVNYMAYVDIALLMKGKIGSATSKIEIYFDSAEFNKTYGTKLDEEAVISTLKKDGNRLIESELNDDLFKQALSTMPGANEIKPEEISKYITPLKESLKKPLLGYFQVRGVTALVELYINKNPGKNIDELECKAEDWLTKLEGLTAVETSLAIGKIRASIYELKAKNR